MSLSDVQEARAIVHASLNGDATTLRILCEKQKTLALQDFVLLSDALALANEVKRTACRDYLISIGAHLWAPCQQFMRAIELQSVNLLTHTCQTYEKSYERNLISDLMAHDAFGEAICMRAITSNEKGRFTHQFIEQRVSFLEQNLDTEEMLCLLSHRYSHHFHDDKSTLPAPVGIANMTPKQLGRLVSEAKSVNVKKHIFNYAFSSLPTDDFITFFLYVSRYFDATSCYESGIMWFTDSKVSCSLIQLYSEACKLDEIKVDTLTQRDIGALDIDEVMARSLNHNCVYHYLSVSGADKLIKLEGEKTLYNFMMRCCLNEYYDTHTF